MISHEEFAVLRLAQFLPAEEIQTLNDWEFLDRIWIGEALGFSEWLRLADEPDVLRSLSLDFDEFPAACTHRVLGTIGLPVRAGMRLDDLRRVLGEPTAEEHFVADRVSYDFRVDEPRYTVNCTVLNDGGLTYVVVTTRLPRRSRKA